MITVTINEKKITLQKRVTILEAARSAGIHVPTLCHDDMLEPYGGCRLCLVEIEKVPRLQTACTQYVADGMVVRTETDEIIKARKSVLEFLLINHPLDCPYCDKAGECRLQDLVEKYGPSAGRFAEGKRKHPESYDDPLIVRNPERCILCSKCVRMCGDVQGASALAITNRGSKSYLEPFSGGKFNCEYCGNCLTVCPTGALTSRLQRHYNRPWQTEKEVETICSDCGVGCSMVIETKFNSIIRSVPKTGLGLNSGLLCSRGRFGYYSMRKTHDLNTPLMRRNGDLVPVSWAEAITYTARRLEDIRKNKGSDTIGGILSGRCTNEDAYVFQKFFRGAIGTNNIDSTASLAYGPAQKYFERIFGQGITANHIQGISNSDGVFVIGGDPTAINPVLGLQIRSACRKGAPVIVIGYAGGLKNFSKHMFIANPTAETVLLGSLVSELKKRKSLSGERPAFEHIINGLQVVPLKDVSGMSGFALDELADMADTLSNMSNPSIVIGRDIIQTSTGHTNLLFLAALVYLLNGRIYLLSELPNEQGLLDMGCQPDMLPSGRPLAMETFRKRCEETLGMAVPSVPGLGYLDLIESAHAGEINALYVMGEDVALSLPDTTYVKDALGKIEFLVVQDRFLTETTRYAEVVLPALSWVEKEGSYTNLERRIQLVRKAVEGEGIEGWKIISEMSRILGLDMGYRSTAEIFAEIAGISHIYKDITYNDMADGKCVWPYRGEPLRHDLHIEGLELPDIISLTKKTDTGIVARREAHLFHSINASRNSPALQSISPEPYVSMSDILAGRLSVKNGEHVKVLSEVGGMTLSVRLDPCLPENVILISPFEKGGIFEITQWKVNPATKAPALDGIRVTIEK